MILEENMRLTFCISPNQVLRSFPPLQASKIKALAISFVPRLPEELYQRLVDHAK
jgi:cell cycle arrest protein BUB2